MSTLGVLPHQVPSSSLKKTKPISTTKGGFRYASIVSSSASSGSSPTPPPVILRDEDLRTTIGRREAIGLGACLNALILFRGAAVGPAMADEEACSFTVSPSGLAYCDKVVGNGAAATKGQLIKAHYVGKLEDGKVFDSSYSRGKPLTFRIGVGEVIKGWDQGILGDEGVPTMLSGGKRTLRIPPELAYGARGAGCKGGSCVIPPGATLVFEVEFLGKA